MDNSELVKSIQDLLQIPAIRKSITTAKPVVKPPNYSRRSNASYYKEKYALELKSVLDAMALDRESREYKYKDSKMTRNSLYIRVNYSLRYLLDFLDPDGTYKKLSEEIKIHRDSTGVKLEFINAPGEEFKPTRILDAEGKKTFQEILDDWLENSPEGAVFQQDKLSLSDEEVLNLKATLGVLDNVAANISQDSIKLIKIS